MFHRGFKTTSVFLPCKVAIVLVTIVFLFIFDTSQPCALPQTESFDDQGSVDAQSLLDMASPAQRAALEKYLLQIAEIDLETQIAVEQYNSAHDRLDAINGDIAQQQVDLDTLGKAYAAQTQQLGERAVMFYKGGGDLAFIEILLDARSIQDFISRLEYISFINVRDMTRLRRIGDEKDRLQESLARLLVDRDEAASLDFELKARKLEIEDRNKKRTDALVLQNPELADIVRAYYLVEQQLESVRSANATLPTSGQGSTAAPKSPAETALAYRGIPYVWGGEDKKGFDAPGLLVYVFAQHQVMLSHSASAQAVQGREVLAQSALQSGDAVFFGKPVYHCGIYIGNGYFIHAPNTGDVVKVSLLSERTDYAGARRYDWSPRSGNPR